MATWRSVTDRKTPRLSRRLVSFAKNPSTALSQEARGGGEVEDPAWMPLKPGQHLRVFVSGVVINDGMDNLPGWHLGFDGVEEADELLMTVALHISADHRAIEDVEGGKQRCGAMPLVVVGHGPAAALLHRQAGLGAVQSLDLAFFVNGKNERVCGRHHIKPNDILNLLNKFWVFRQLEVLEPVRLKAVTAPNALHRTHRNARSLGHGGRGPVRDLAPWRAERQFHHPGNGLLSKRLLARGPRLVLQKTVHALPHIAFLPAPDAGLRLARPPHDLGGAAAGAGEQYDIGPPNVLLGPVAIHGDRLKASSIRRSNREGNSSAHASRLA